MTTIVRYIVQWHKYIHIIHPRCLHDFFSSFPTETLSPSNSDSPRPLPQPLATPILLPVSVILTIPGTSYKRNHTVLVSRTWHTSPSIMYVLKFHPHCSACQDFLPYFEAEPGSLACSVPRSIHPSNHWRMAPCRGNSSLSLP